MYDHYNMTKVKPREIPKPKQQRPTRGTQNLDCTFTLPSLGFRPLYLPFFEVSNLVAFLNLDCPLFLLMLGIFPVTPPACLGATLFLVFLCICNFASSSIFFESFNTLVLTKQGLMMMITEFLLRPSPSSQKIRFSTLSHLEFPNFQFPYVYDDYETEELWRSI